MKIGKRRLAAMVFAGSMALAAAVNFADVPKDGSAKDWPQFHGPARDNISKETGLLKEWPQGGPPLAWKAKGIGEGHSSVSVAGGKIFTAGAEGSERSGGTTSVVALNEADGKIAWKSKLGENWKNDQGGFGSRATPTVDGDRVYMIGPVGDVACFNAADGKEIWHANLKNDFGGNPPGWGFSESPTIDGDNMICTPGGRGGTVLALNKMTGKEVWRSKDFKDAAAYAPTLIADIGGVHQIVSFTEQHLAGINAKDGSVLWVADRPGKTAVIPTPVIKDDYIFVTSGYKVGCDLFKINFAGGKFTPEKIYSNGDMQDHHGGVIGLDGNIYGHSDSKGWVCMDMLTGKVKWSDKGVGKGSIAYADGHFYCRSEGKTGTIALIEASPDGYKEHGRFDQPDRSGKQAWPHPVIANGKLYIRDMDTLLCYDIKAK
jgi:outer membrane protein assembly factor BamB